MAVGVAQVRDAAPGVGRGGVFQVRAGRHGLIDRAVHVGHHHVQMHRRPVACIVAPLRRGAGRARARGFFKQVDGGVGAVHFRRLRPQPSMQRQPECALIEVNGVIQIGHIDIDEKLHEGVPV
ncbi:hypothetical protein D3C87_1544670 [compost metagenome]